MTDSGTMQHGGVIYNGITNFRITVRDTYVSPLQRTAELRQYFDKRSVYNPYYSLLIIAILGPTLSEVHFMHTIFLKLALLPIQSDSSLYRDDT